MIFGDLKHEELRSDEDPDRPEPFIIRGEAARRAGNLDAARSSFNARAVQVAGETALDWAWDHIKPTQADKIEIGSGLDLGYIRGFYLPERDKDGNTFRWTSTNPEIRWAAPLADVSFAWNGWRPSGSASAKLDYIPPSTGSRGVIISYVKDFANVDAWTTDTLADLTLANEFPDTNNDCAVSGCFALAMNGFVSAGDDPRLLGIRVSSVGTSK